MTCEVIWVVQKYIFDRTPTKRWTEGESKSMAFWLCNCLASLLHTNFCRPPDCRWSARCRGKPKPRFRNQMHDFPADSRIFHPTWGPSSTKGREKKNKKQEQFNLVLKALKRRLVGGVNHYLGSLEFRGYARCGGEGAEDGDEDHREDWEEAMWVFFTFHICGFLGGGEKAWKERRERERIKGAGLLEALKVLRDTAKDACILVELFEGLCLYWLRPSSEEIFHCLLL